NFVGAAQEAAHDSFHDSVGNMPTSTKAVSRPGQPQDRLPHTQTERAGEQDIEQKLSVQPTITTGPKCCPE
ncbi:MAG: hypothetical protein WBE48_16605, partial [Xanthobacteraceae bacterium]